VESPGEETREGGGVGRGAGLVFGGRRESRAETRRRREERRVRSEVFSLRHCVAARVGLACAVWNASRGGGWGRGRVRAAGEKWNGAPGKKGDAKRKGEAGSGGKLRELAAGETAADGGPRNTAWRTEEKRKSGGMGKLKTEAEGGVSRRGNEGGRRGGARCRIGFRREEEISRGDAEAQRRKEGAERRVFSASLRLCAGGLGVCLVERFAWRCLGKGEGSSGWGRVVRLPRIGGQRHPR